MVVGTRSENENKKAKRKGQEERTRRADELMRTRRSKKKGKIWGLGSIAVNPHRENGARRRNDIRDMGL